jgi:hypothetical protein
MSRIAAVLIALLLSWPAYAADLTLELECHPAELVKQTIRSGEIAPVAFGMNADGELIILFAVTSGGYWMGLVIEGGTRVCGLSAGPVWQAVIPGQPT